MAQAILANTNHQTATKTAHKRKAMARAIKELAEDRGAFETVDCDDLRALGFTESEISTHSSAAKGMALREINFTPAA